MESAMRIFLLFLVAGFASSSHISTEVFEPHRPHTRSLLQRLSSCSVNMENLNYTVITSQCQGTNYTFENCCTPLKMLVCPISDQFNDLRTDCADMFFSYVNRIGDYPPGLFASICTEDRDGLDCSTLQESSNVQTKASKVGSGL